jgi:hypothetical protein
MAEYQLTRHEYEQLVDRRPVARAWWVKYLSWVLLVLITLALFMLLAYLRQWLFGAFVLLFIVFIVVMSRRFEPVDFARDSFKAGRVHLEVLPDAIRIRAGSNQVQFAYAELGDVLEYPRGFVILHRSGMQVRVPKGPLSEAEVSTLIGLQHALPKIARKMYK